MLFKDITIDSHRNLRQVVLILRAIKCLFFYLEHSQPISKICHKDQNIFYLLSDIKRETFTNIVREAFMPIFLRQRRMKLNFEL